MSDVSDIDMGFKVAYAFGRTLWSLTDLTDDELKIKAKKFAEGVPFLVNNLEAFCLEVAKGYAQAKAEYQQQLATLN